MTYSNTYPTTVDIGFNDYSNTRRLKLQYPDASYHFLPLHPTDPRYESARLSDFNLQQQMPDIIDFTTYSTPSE